MTNILMEALRALNGKESKLNESVSSVDDIVTAEFYTDDFDLNDWNSGYPELMSRLVVDISNSVNKKDQFDITRYTVTGSRKDIEEFTKLSIQDYGCVSKEEAEVLYGKGVIPTIIESLNESVEDVNSIIDDFKQGFEDPKIRARSYPNGIFVFLDFVNDKEKYLRLNEVNGQYEAYWFETKTTWQDVKSEEKIIGKFKSFEEMIKYLADNKWFTDDSEITLDDAATFLNK